MSYMSLYIIQSEKRTFDLVFHLTLMREIATCLYRWLFSCGKLRGVIMASAKNILCPRCGRKVASHDGKSTIISTIKCKKCETFVVYNPITDKTTRGKEMERSSSSGKRFY